MSKSEMRKILEEQSEAYLEWARDHTQQEREMSYNKARKIVEKIITNLGPDVCTFGEKFPEAYEYLQSFKADLIEDVKSELERRD